MKFIDAESVARALPYDDLIDRLRDVYRRDGMVARRELISLESHNGASGSCVALMPAFGPGCNIVTKIATLFPANRQRGLATVQAIVVVFDGEDGCPLAVIDGTELTRRRTAAMCGLASTYLSRENSERLLVCGAGSLASHAALAHASVRPVRSVSIWARRKDAAAEVVKAVAGERPDLHVTVVTDLPQACREAEIISCQTSAATPVVFGEWIQPGTHMDFVGSHDPDRRECDDVAVSRASIFVDVMESAMLEAGDILIPIANGSIRREDVLGELGDLCRGSIRGRRDDDEITLFKSTGSGLADLAAAMLVIQNNG